MPALARAVAASAAGLLLLAACGGSGDEATDVVVFSTCGPGVPVTTNKGNAGEDQTCIQTVRNEGRVTARALQYRLTLPAGLSLNRGWCVTGDGNACGALTAAAGGLPDLAPGQSLEVWLELRSPPLTNASYTATFEAGARNDAAPGNNATSLFVQARSVDLKGVLEAPANVAAGSEFDVVLRLTNAGPVAVLADPPAFTAPEQTAVLSWSATDAAGNPAFPVSGKSFAGWWLEAGTTLTFRYRTVAAEAARGPLRFSVEIAPIGDPVPDDNYPKAVVEATAP